LAAAVSFSPVATPLGWIGRNRILALALLLASVLSLGGAGWGRVECWNVDEMAFRGTQSNGLPWGYLKPPLHTYLNHLLIMKPAEAVRTVLGLERSWQFPVQLWGTRLLTLALFLGMLLLLHRTAARLAGRRGAAVIVLLAATSAGLIKFNHFATCDSPLLFWMVASFALAVRAALTGRRSDAFLAGLLAGLATADKYNGLGVAAAIPAVLLAARGWRGLLGSLPWMGLLGVTAGFFLGKPGCVFDTRNFVQDFLYNLYTTPVYNGETKGTGYVDFLLAFPELVGWPGSLLLLGAVGASVVSCCWGGSRGRNASCCWGRGPCSSFTS
jgi:4-amino-4-deoxy-L-arabinose transferase-like glycosyltransferase